MSTLVLNIEKTHSQHELVELFKKNKLSKGDKLNIQSREELPPMAVIGALFFLALCVGIYFHTKQQRRKDAEKLLDDLFKDRSAEELEKQIENEYGIEVGFIYGTDEEHADWLKLSAQNLSHAYGDDEPEYTFSMVKEPNPDYIP